MRLLLSTALFSLTLVALPAANQAAPYNKKRAKVKDNTKSWQQSAAESNGATVVNGVGSSFGNIFYELASPPEGYPSRPTSGQSSSASAQATPRRTDQESGSVESDLPFYPTGYEKMPLYAGKPKFPKGIFLGNVACDYYPSAYNESTCKLPITDEEQLSSCLTETTNSDCTSTVDQLVVRVANEVNFRVPPALLLFKIATLLREAWGSSSVGTAFLEFSPSPVFYSPAYGASFEMKNCKIAIYEDDSDCVLCMADNNQQKKRNCNLIFAALAPPIFGDTEFHFWDMPSDSLLSADTFGKTEDADYSPRKSDNKTYWSNEYEANKDTRKPYWGTYMGAYSLGLPILNRY
eukprot:gb/GEZN01009077.1/.p1 GENE.gb/GEZN01009077.1/~~gb/GEZN01009077.1/.p1  ORF type:complete len:349 (+),score=38.95 gb/GEZN01009077.1/:40-1086(+)